MALLTPTVAKIAGVAITAITPNVGGDTIPVGDHEAVLADNTSGGSITITVAVPGNTQFGQAQPDVPIAIPAGTKKVIGPFPRELADPTDRLVHLTYSAVTDLDLYLIQV